MSSDVETFFRFLEDQKPKQASHFPTVKFDKVLSFMGTTSLAGSFNAVSVNRILALEPTGAGRELHVSLRGPIARSPRRGECVTVHITRVEQYQGYQVKTRALAAGGPESDLLEVRGDEVRVKGAQIFTVHHSPYTLKFFEHVPFDELEETIGGVRYALVGVGETANLSPRFIFHHEVVDGRPVLYHGDGLALKTYMNLKSNRQESRLVLDLDHYSGWLLRGTVEEFQPHQHPVAYDRICQGFAAGNWGKPSRVFRFQADALETITPAG
ncbi:MAG TPA: hypothetical protein VLS93_18265 [Anaeromyxobacteraceae bacterium]|nr:hypothetical protein [Anaeromyxobacteraceae bacterium]